jgi:dolichol-phosphate mannosyltransferase
LKTVVITALSEQETVGPLIEEARARGFDKIMVADGYSHDRTTEVAAGLGAEVAFRYGKGEARVLLTAFQRVTTPYLVVMDGDGSYDPSGIQKSLPPMRTYDFVKGMREKKENMSGVHGLGNRIITRTFNLLFGTSVGDVCSGMSMLGMEKVRGLHLEQHPLAVEQEIAAEMALSSGPITTIPINYRRMGGSSETNTWKQGFRDLLTNFDLARTYNPVLLFTFFGALAIVPGGGLLIYTLVLNYAFGDYHSGFFLGSAILLVLGMQGLVVSTITAMFRRIERKLSSSSESRS